MSKGLVSIIVPTHNRAAMLSRAIDSIFHQSYKNIEVIIVANGCTDNTHEVVKSLQKKYKNIHFLNFTEPIGGAEARNRGLDIIEGEYVAFLDDDDEWLKDKLEDQLMVFTNSNYSIVGCNYYKVGTNRVKQIKLPEKISFYQMTFENILGSFSFCITKSEYIKELRIDKALKANQDYDLWLKIMKSTDKDAYVVQKPLVNYLQHNIRVSTNLQHRIDAQSLFLGLWDSEFDQKARDYGRTKILLLKLIMTKNLKEYILSLPFILRSIYHSPYRFTFKKYYIYVNIFRYFDYKL